MKHVLVGLILPLALAGTAMAQSPIHEMVAQPASAAPLPPPCEAPLPRTPAQPPGPPAPAPAPCRP
jgi:hypothetical protein